MPITLWSSETLTNHLHFRRGGWRFRVGTAVAVVINWVFLKLTATGEREEWEEREEVEVFGLFTNA